jgi:hypothetical protein
MGRQVLAQLLTGMLRQANRGVDSRRELVSGDTADADTLPTDSVVMTRCWRSVGLTIIEGTATYRAPSFFLELFRGESRVRA